MIAIRINHVIDVKINRFGFWYPKIQIRLAECKFAKENSTQIKSGQPCPDSIKNRLDGWELKIKSNLTFHNEFELKKSKSGFSIPIQMKDFSQDHRWDHWWEHFWDNSEISKEKIIWKFPKKSSRMRNLKNSKKIELNDWCTFSNFWDQKQVNFE